MKTFLTTSAIGFLYILNATAANAAGEVKDIELTANIGFVSEYSFRGIAQSNEKPAIQGGFDITHSSGFYAGVWGSNVDFNDGNEATLETDLYVGYSNEYKGLSYDIGTLYYAYPGADDSLDYDYTELALSLGYDFEIFSVSASANYSPNNFADSGDAWYTAAGIEVPLPHDFKINGHIGYQTIDDADAFGVNDYMDWSAGIGYSNWGFDFGLQYIDTNLPYDQCEDGCDERVIGSISRSF